MLRKAAAVLMMVAVALAALEEDDEVTKLNVTERFDAFDWALCKALNRRSPGNVVVSPVGLKLVLAMLYEGATGQTARELETGLKMGRDRQHTRDKYSAVLSSLQENTTDYLLEAATKIYMHQDLELQSRFERIMRTFYNTDVQNVDFANASNTIADINEWVSNKTHGYIKNFLNQGSVKPTTVMVLLSAIFFKGTWKYPFPPQNTYTNNFHVKKGLTVPSQFMDTSEMFFYSHSDEIKAKILQLPYKGGKFSMFVVLPDDVDGLEKLIDTINPFTLREHLTQLTKTVVRVVLPKFKFDFEVELNDVLKEVGILEIFTASANLPGIGRVKTGSPLQLYVSTVIQKSGLEVNEQGTTAFSVTGVMLDDRVGVRAEVFEATHPFLFFIEDRDTGAVVFVGKVVEPQTPEPTPSSTPTPTPTPKPTPKPRKPSGAVNATSPKTH